MVDGSKTASSRHEGTHRIVGHELFPTKNVEVGSPSQEPRLDLAQAKSVASGWVPAEQWFRFHRLPSRRWNQGN